MNPRQLLPQVLGLALTIGALAGCGGASPEPTATPEPVTETEIIRYVPPVPDEVREGSCQRESETVVRKGSWRCTVGGETFDPCFVAEDGETIVCGTGPRMDDPGFKLKLTQPLPVFEWPDALPGAFMMELADGTLCHCQPGWIGVEGKHFNCTCDDEGQGADLIMLGELQVKGGPVWRAEKAILGGEEGSYFFKESEIVSIRTVWH
jgi:hypothetical protein